MSVPKLRFPEFWDAGEWEKKPLGNKTIKVGSGITPNGGEKNYKSKGRPFIRSQNIGWGCLLLDDVVFIDDITHSTFSATEINEGDVFLNITGASIGRSAVADYRVQGGNVNQHVCIIRAEQSELNSYYLNQYLLSQYGQKQIDSFQSGGNRQGLNFAQIRSFSLPLPLIEEQQKIAACLSSIDDRITAETKKLDTLKAHKKGLMQKLFPAEGETLPKLRFPEFQDSGEWEEKKLRDAIDPVVREVAKPTSKYLALGIRSHGKGTFQKPDQAPEKNAMDKLYLVNRDDLIVNITFAWEGAIAIADNTDHGCLVSHRFPTYVFKSQISTSKFFRYVINQKSFFYKLGLISPGGAGRNRVMNKKDFLEISVSLPSLKEQQKIADCLSSIDEAIAAQAQAIDLLKLHKKGLMQQLFPSVNGEE